MTLEPPPEPRPSEKLVAIAIAAVSELPSGSILGEAYAQWVGTPYQRRFDAWLRQLHQLVIDLEARSIDASELLDRPEYFTALHDAARIALGEHLEAKLVQLRAVLLAAACRADDPHADLTALRFLRLVDELHVDHVEFLHQLAAPGRERDTFPTITPFDDLTAVEQQRRRIVIGDLQAHQLISVWLPSWILPEVGPSLLVDDGAGSGATDLGRQFLDWLSIV